MDLVMIILGSCVLLCLFFIWYINTYNRFQEYIIRVNEAEANIDSVLRKRFDLLNKSIGIIKENTNENKKILTVIDDLRSKMLSNFELDRVLYDALNEFHTYAEKYDTLKKNDSFTRIEIGLNESEAEITALRKYYNDIITDYNKLAKKFPTIIVAKLCKYKVKTYYDGKNMEDDIVDDFKL